MAAGRAAVASGSHRVDAPPSEGGRWGPSIVLLPSGELAAALDRYTTDILAITDGGHWPSGGRGRAHATVRALEPYTEVVPEERTCRYVAAIERALSDVGPIHLDFSGLVLSAGGVMACASSPDGSADGFRDAIARELGADGWLEDTVFENGRDPIWYCSLVHFAHPVLAPERLIASVDAHRDTAIGHQTFDSVALCQWTFDGVAMAPVVTRSVCC